MAASAENVKQKVHALIEQLPDTATWEDVLEELRFVQAVEQGLTEADRGEFAKSEEVRAAFASWGATLES